MCIGLTLLSHFDQIFNTMGKKLYLVYKEKKLLLPGGGIAGAGSGDILNKGMEVQVQVARCKIIVRGWDCRCRFR